MTQIKLPKHLDTMKSREKKKLSQALDRFAEAARNGDEDEKQKILKEHNLEIQP